MENGRVCPRGPTKNHQNHQHKQKQPKPPKPSKTNKSNGSQRKWQGVPQGSGGGSDGIERKLGEGAPGEFVCFFVCLRMFVCFFV
jgi:hypothetical protein